MWDMYWLTNWSSKSIRYSRARLIFSYKILRICNSFILLVKSWVNSWNPESIFESDMTHRRRSSTHNTNSALTVIISNSSKVHFSDESLHIWWPTWSQTTYNNSLFSSWFLDITASAQSHMPVQLCIRPFCIWFGLFPQTSPKYVFFMNDFWMAHRHFYSDVSLHIYSRHLSQSRYTHVRRSLTHNPNSNNTVLILNSSKVLFFDESLHIY